MKGKQKKEEKGIIEGLFKSFGLENLIDTLKQSSAFKERLKETDERVKENLEKGIGTEVKPQVQSRLGIRPIMREQMKATRLGTQRVRLKEVPPLIEVFEEKNELKVVAELPTIKEEEINIKLKDRQLTINAKDFTKTIELPCKVKPDIKKLFANNVLEIKLEKLKERKETNN